MRLYIFQATGIHFSNMKVQLQAIACLFNKYQNILPAKLTFYGCNSSGSSIAARLGRSQARLIFTPTSRVNFDVVRHCQHPHTNTSVKHLEMTTLLVIFLQYISSNINREHYKICHYHFPMFTVLPGNATLITKQHPVDRPLPGLFECFIPVF